MADSAFSGNTTTTFQNLKLIIPFSGNTAINNKTTPFIDPNEHINANKINIIRSPNPITLKNANLKTVKKPTFKVGTIYKAMDDVGEEVRNKKNLFGDLIGEGSLNIFFSRAGTGKSFLSKQCCEAFATGRNVLDIMNYGIVENQSTTNNFNLNNETLAQKILYIDFEATAENDFIRYTVDSVRKNLSLEVHPYHFSDNFIIAYPDELSTSDNLLFIDAIEEEVKKCGAKILFIDNMSAISWENEKSSNAARLMNKIRDMQRRNKLTVVVMAHTTKIIKGQPILDTNLAGSFNVYALAENVFAIGESEMDNSIRYIIQLKVRYGQVHFHKDNVIALQFKEFSNGFKGFEFLNYETEEALLEIITKQTKMDENREIINAVRLGINATPAEIAKDLYEKFYPDKEVSISTFKQRIRQQYNRLKNKGMFDQNTTTEQTPEMKKLVIPDRIIEGKTVDRTPDVIPIETKFIQSVTHMETDNAIPTSTPSEDAEKILIYTQEQLDNFEDIILCK